MAQEDIFYDVLIVGGGHAGAQLAITLRQMGFAGSVAIVGAEHVPPYERPPLSKEYLSGAKSFERILIRPESFWGERNVAMILGERVMSVDPGKKRIVTASGRSMGYGSLVWAAGGSPRRLACAGSDASNIHVVRNLADVDAIAAALPQVTHVTIVGGGYIGLEAAAVMRKMDKAVTLLEVGPRLLGRVTGEALSAFVDEFHRAKGVDVRTATGLASFETQDGRVVAAVLDNGQRIATDMVIAGIGIVPEVGALQDAGASVANGVMVDACCRTSLPDIFAIGDCAASPNPWADGAHIRVESVQNANDQAKIVANLLMDVDKPVDAMPWFWSNQYDLKLQSVGLSMGHDLQLVRGDRATASFSILYLREGRLIAVDTVNRVKDYVQARALVAAGARLDASLAVDPDIALKDVVAAAA
ncbi:FAD-dependent oxidoreductase [Sphingobium sp.]|uniref:NAD(P)/FAD-dependent oxidoreductase n=1 Tax=Sphingobium sp. TaxID=1912891 RepID=UPI00262769E0|nr:FAD-dependent oxidoreductase [Sphingobium sp.]